MKEIAKSRITRKVLAVAIAAAMLTGTGLTTIGTYVGTNLTVNAASTATIVESGTCGENVTYTLDSKGTLTISGEGDMATGFYFNSDIKSVIIKNGVTGIVNSAFHGCTNLTNITIPDSVTSIGGYAFYHCNSLRGITIPNNITSIEESTFSGCSGLTNITIPNGVTNIERSAFSDCTSVTSIIIPNSVTSIGRFAFSGCSGLTSITIPNSVTSIRAAVFSGCSGLTSVTIPNSVTSIGDSAYYRCSGLTSVTIPSSVTSIGSTAFGYDTQDRKISDFTIKGTAGSAAETYAEKNDFKFVDVNAKPINSGSTISTTTTTAGSKVTVKANFTNGNAPYQYLYAYQKDGGAWKTVKNYSDTSSADITLPSIGNYTIRIKCKDAEGKIVNKDFTVKVNDSKVLNSSTIDTTEITLGKSVKLTGAATGGTGDYTYAVFYKQASQTTWTKAQDYKSSITAAVTPKAATTYNIRVKVKDSAGKITNKDFTVKVNAKLANKSTIDKTTAKLGQSFKLTGAATGGAGSYTYAVYYKQASQTTWTKAQDYKSSITAAVTPKTATTYNIRVKLKDSNGTIVNKDFMVTVTK